MRVFFVIVILVSVCGFFVNLVDASRFQQKYVWKVPSFAWPSYEAEQQALATGRYIPENNNLLAMDLWSDKVFITIPRWRPGVAATLNYIQLPTDKTSPVLQPYPNWEAHDLERNFPETPQSRKRALTGLECSEYAPKDESRSFQEVSGALVSPYRAKPDECNRLWVLDSGIDQFLTNFRQVIPPTLVVFDLNTNKAIHRYSIPDEFITKSSTFPNLAIDITDGDCINTFVYIADVTGFGLIVYSLKQNRSWRIKHNFFHNDPLDGNFFIDGINFQVPEGIFGLALGNQKSDKSKDLFFHSLSSTKEFVVSNQIVQNETLSMSKDAFYAFNLLGDRGMNGQSGSEIFHKNTGIMFYSQVNKDGVGCWNSQKPYTPEMQGMVDSDSSSLVYVNEFFIDKGDNLWIMSIRLPRVLFGKGLNASEDNYRILGGRISDLIVGTPCDFVDDSYYLQDPDYYKK